MQSNKFDLGFEENQMSSTHKLDRVYGLKEILPFDGEASTKQAGYRREVGVELTSQAAVTVERCHLEFKRCLE